MNDYKGKAGMVYWSPHSVVCLSVGLSPSEACKNGRSDRYAVCIDDSGGSRETPVVYSGPLRVNTVLCSLNTIQPSSIYKMIIIMCLNVGNLFLSLMICYVLSFGR